MNNKPKRHLITAALPYTNGPLHIGQIAGAYLPADTYARYLKSKGEDVVFVCGSDEHGAAITLRAKKEGVSPQEIVDKYHQLIESTFSRFGMCFDIYHRTSSELHHHTAADFFKVLHEKGAFESQSSEQYFDEKHQQFLADRYIKGTCPVCGNENAYGDQCEKCGTSLSPLDLINPVSTLSGEKPVLKTTSHWYLPMQNHEEWLRKWLTEGELDGELHHDANGWKRNVLGQCLSWLDNGLQPRAMTRDLDWGVKVPLPDHEGKVLYVWLDAPIGYISATKQWALAHHKRWEDYWQSDDSHLVHFIGKDNIVFHCIIFPIILKSHGAFNLPVNVPANEFLNLEGQKISTSRNWAVWLHEYLDDFPGKADELRFVLTSISPEVKDSEFSWADFQARVNNELVAIYGNFINRTLVLTHKYFKAEVPQLASNFTDGLTLLQTANEKLALCTALIEQFKFREALFEAMQIARMGNKFLADTEPWKLINTDKEAVANILSTCLHISALLAKAFYPFMPESSLKLCRMLSLEMGKTEFEAGHKIQPAELLFEKITDEQVAEQLQKLKDKATANAASAAPMYAPVLPEITFDQFAKLDLRVGQIIAAEKVKKADKLLHLTVDLGFEQRSIVSGIAQHFSPEEVVGKMVTVLSNLAPRNLRGVESKGMVLMGETSEGKLAFVTPNEALKPGDVVR